MTPTDTILVSGSDHTAAPSPSVVSASASVGEVDVEVTELDLSGRPREKEVGVPRSVVLVDWDGEDDPENPLNWLVPVPPLWLLFPQ